MNNDHICEIGIFWAKTTEVVHLRCVDRNCEKMYRFGSKVKMYILDNYGINKLNEIELKFKRLTKLARTYGISTEGREWYGFDLYRIF